MRIIIKILKITAGVILGLAFSFLTIVGLNAILPSENPFGGPSANLWWFAIVIAVWTFFFLWLMMRWKTPVKNRQTPKIENLPVSVSELINSIMDAMKYRRCVRAEVRQELADHFADALGVKEFGFLILCGDLAAAVGSEDDASPLQIEQSDEFDGIYTDFADAKLSVPIAANKDGKLYFIGVDLVKSHKRFIRVKDPHVGNGTATDSLLAIVALTVPGLTPTSAADAGCEERVLV